MCREDDYVLVVRKLRHADSFNEPEISWMKAWVSEDENSAFDHLRLGIEPLKIEQIVSVKGQNRVASTNEDAQVPTSKAFISIP